MAPHLRTGAERLGSGCRQRARMDVPLAAAWLLLLSQLPGAEAFARKRMPQQLPGDVNAVQQVLAAAGVADAKVLQRFADEEMDMTALYWCSRQTLKELGVTHVLNASGLPPTFPKAFTYLSVDLRDKVG